MQTGRQGGQRSQEGGVESPTLLWESGRRGDGVGGVEYTGGRGESGLSERRPCVLVSKWSVKDSWDVRGGSSPVTS